VAAPQGADGGLLPRNKSIKPLSRNLRKNATRQENHLWYDYLKNHEPRFTRQRIIGNFIVDFFCYEAKLVIELDGSQHYEPNAADYDKARTKYFNDLGIDVLRFPNSDIDKNFAGVCQKITDVVRGKQTPAAVGGTPFEKGALIAEGCAATRIEDAFREWEHVATERFDTLKTNEEELNRIFINIYGLQDELAPEVEDKDVTVRRADLGREIRSFISYAVGCMFGRYSLDCVGLAFAGGEWDTSKYQTYPADKDNILPICDDEYFDDDIVGLFVDFVRVVYGTNTLQENLRFIADALAPFREGGGAQRRGLSGTGTPREVIRKYFLTDFYKNHLKIYQKRPIYWLFDSGKKNGFKALIYMHRYSRDLLAKLRTDYVHEQQERYRTQLAHTSDAMQGASGAERVKLGKLQSKLIEQSAEIAKYEEKIHHLADQNIEIDLDDGVKKNYEIFADIVAKIG
jgi:very-short-patch-repair endonuclease